MTSLVNLHDNPRGPFVRIDRGTYFGNYKYLIGRDGDRYEVLEKYKKYFYNRILTDQKFRDSIESLRGKVLACWCCPDLCHGMIIIEYLEGIPCNIERPKNEPNKFFEL